jgi:hypothetical protein
VKFGRTYKMTIDGQFYNGPLAWTPAFPTTLKFDVQRNTFASANTGKFTLYNLSAAARKDIYFDRYVLDRRLKVRLQAGYVGSPVLPTIFQGDIRVAWSERRGPDWVTNIEAFDGGSAIYQAQAIGVAPISGYTMQSAAAALVATMSPYGVQLGKVSNISLPNTCPKVFVGNSWAELKKLVPGDGQLFIDQGVVNILNPEDYLLTPTVPLISAATGLLDIPRRFQNLTNVRLVFDPQYIVAQLAALLSIESWLSAPALKVMGLHHYGTISGVEAGDLVTELSLFRGYPQQTLVPVDTASETQEATA